MVLVNRLSAWSLALPHGARHVAPKVLLRRELNLSDAQIRDMDTLSERWGSDWISTLAAMQDAGTLDEELEIASVVRGRPFPARDAEPTPPGLIFDIASFRAYPGDGLVSGAVRLRTEPPYPWVLGGLLP